MDQWAFKCPNHDYMTIQAVCSLKRNMHFYICQYILIFVTGNSKTSRIRKERKRIKAKGRNQRKKRQKEERV